MVIKMENHPTEELEAIIPMENVSSGSPAMLRSQSIEEPEAIIPMEIVSSGSPTMLRIQSTEEPEAIIPMEIVSSGSPTIATTATTTTTTTVGLRRKATRRTESWHLPPPPRRGTRQRQLPKYFASLPPPPQDEDIPARKKRRLEESQPTTTTTDVGARKTGSQDILLGLPPPAADIDNDDANEDPSTDTKLDAVVTGNWTLEEVSKLTRAVADTSKKRWGKEYKTDWDAVAALVPGRTTKQCWSRWKDFLDSSIDRANGRTGKWTAIEDGKLKNAVQSHGGKDWVAIAALVPGRTRKQCWGRWKDVLDSSIDRANGRTGKWAENEDDKLKDAVQRHGGKNWAAIATLVPDRTEIQCHDRWHHVLDLDRANGRTGSWTALEDIKLKNAVQTHGGKNWGTIAALVPGRTQKQCNSRWHDFLDPSIDRANGRTGKWAEDEDIKLKNAVQTHGGKNWGTIAVLVPGRTKGQCRDRWHNCIGPSIDRANRRTDKWVEDEDIKLKVAVHVHGGKNWGAIAALVPGRTKKQCSNRWNNVLDPNIDRGNGRTGHWGEDEDSKLKDAVQKHGCKDWDAITALVPGRTKHQCQSRWQVLRRSPE
jgi:hypothetical protein